MNQLENEASQLASVDYLNPLQRIQRGSKQASDVWKWIAHGNSVGQYM